MLCVKSILVLFNSSFSDDPIHFREHNEQACLIYAADCTDYYSNDRMVLSREVDRRSDRGENPDYDNCRAEAENHAAVRRF